LGIPYFIRFAEDDVEFQNKHNIKGAPKILVDGELIFRGMHTIYDLMAYFKKKT
jgi:hypothetical protein